MLVYGLSNSSNCDDLECPLRSFRYFQVRYFVFVAHRAVPVHLQSFLCGLQQSLVEPLISVQCWHVHCERCWLQVLQVRTAIDVVVVQLHVYTFTVS